MEEDGDEGRKEGYLNRMQLLRPLCYCEQQRYKEWNCSLHWEPIILPSLNFHPKEDKGKYPIQSDQSNLINFVIPLQYQ